MNLFIRDRFVTGIRNDQLRADLLRHRKDDGAIVTLEEVVKKAKAWEISTRINAQVMESQRTAEQVNFTKSEEERSGRRRQC